MAKEMNAAVQAFMTKVNQALKGKNAVQEIQAAVWEMLKELGIEVSKK